MLHGTPRKVAIVGANRIPFARSGTAYSQLSNSTMLTDTLKGLPVPVVLPLASLQYRKSAVMASFMPGPRGNGNVLFLFGRIAY